MGIDLQFAESIAPFLGAPVLLLRHRGEQAEMSVLESLAVD
ncbi:hypothetical protein [Limnothrix redekei]|uniref:Uncharacterized protein n=1 Tax=Limnothrix redekei LRLZ20PSL1 TaxID=3112953 RepID=A0ABW7C847_9CYAN